MNDFLKSLEPRREFQNVILYNELDEFHEILFFTKGQVDIGFEINRKKYFTLRRTKNFIMGDLGCTFN